MIDAKLNVELMLAPALRCTVISLLIATLRGHPVQLLQFAPAPRARACSGHRFIAPALIQERLSRGSAVVVILIGIGHLGETKTTSLRC